MPLSAAKQGELHRRDSLLQFESVKRWLASETIRATSTKQAYLKYLAILVNHLNCTPDELVGRRIADMAQQDFAKRQRLEQIVRELRREVSMEGKAKACMFVAAICSFMKANTGARLNINNPLPEIAQEVWMYEGEPSREQDFWCKIVDYAPNIRDAAVFLIGLEAGPRDGSLVRMTVADVIGEFSGGTAPYKIVVPPPGESPTKKRGGFNFIAEDAKANIEAYLSLRRMRFGEFRMRDQFLVDLETGLPLQAADCINDALRKAFLDSGALSHDQVYPPDVRMSPVRWYCFRKRAQTIMEDNTDGTGIALNWVDELLSHRMRGQQAKHYSRPTVPQLRAAYAKAMHRIMIYREPKRAVSQDQVDQAVQRVLKDLIGEKVPRELEKMQNQIVSARNLARILREATAVSEEAE
jgi:uncharacterized protein (DUF2267 family)